ncbi:MAG: potassium channel family protein [Halioglobus sp.]|nr:potassium channel family protein [Halioglobus sp.]
MVFINLFFTVLYLGLPLLLALLCTMILLGVIVGHRERWSIFDSIYWALITGFTVGYGDIRPITRLSKLMAIIIAWAGIMFTGVIVAATVVAGSNSIKEHIKDHAPPEELQSLKQKFPQD